MINSQLYITFRISIVLILIQSCVLRNQEIIRDENGNVILKCELKKGVRHGTCYAYYPNGNIRVISSWIAGFQDGETIEYFENGSIHVTTMLQSGKQHGQRVAYYKNGIVNATSMWKDNQQDGETISYDENGNFESKIIFINGQIKEIEFYDKEGRLVKHAFYIILNGQSTLNGLLVFASHDADGNPDEIIWSKTAYAEIFTERDTIDYGSFVEYEINWWGGIPDDYVGAMAGNYDHNFNLIDSTSLKIIDLDNKNRFYPAHLGTDTLRIIFDFFKHEDGKEKVFSSHLEKVFTVIGKNE